MDRSGDPLVVGGDSRAALRYVPADCVRCCVTSPPYWSLRDYQIPGQIGLEAQLADYFASLVAVFEEVRRVLTRGRTLWLNIGDSYTSGGRTWRAPDKKNPVRAMSIRPPTPDGLKPKDLIGVPWRLAFALQAAGWYLRADIVWNKPNCQPESVKDRPTRSHEMLFLFSKSEQYHYDPAAVRGPNGRNLRTRLGHPDPAVQGGALRGLPAGPGRTLCGPGQRAGRPGARPVPGLRDDGARSRMKMGRRFLGIELNPEYVEIARRRLESAFRRRRRVVLRRRRRLQTRREGVSCACGSCSAVGC